jgi:hypothetical protein
MPELNELPDQPGRPPSELELQRRWAESRWPTPFLQTGEGESVRVITPGRWNRGPGPDFRGAQILDGQGRAQRGDVELHLEPAGWLQHGHAGDPAYQHLLLHIVAWDGRPRRAATTTDARIPAATALPYQPQPQQAPGSALADLPCAGIVSTAGAAAVESRLLQISRRRFLRKVGELRALAVPSGPGSEDDRRAVIAAARALGQPHNAAISERAAGQALQRDDRWDEFAPQVEQVDLAGWRRGRGALGSPAGLSSILKTLIERWTRADATPWSAFERLAKLPLRPARDELRIAGSLGAGRSTQLLADAVYPLTRSWLQWTRLPGARYQRSDALRERIADEQADPRSGFRWRHPQTQALLELEQTRCRQWACKICPLAALVRSG